MSRAGATRKLKCKLKFANWTLALIFPLGAIAWPLSVTAKSDPSSLCTKGETKLFSCPVLGKIASICRAQEGAFTYRFGRPGRIELQAGNLRFARADSDSNEYQIWFRHGGDPYIVYSQWWHSTPGSRGSTKASGIAVIRNDLTVFKADCQQLWPESWIDPKAFRALPKGAFVEHY